MTTTDLERRFTARPVEVRKTSGRTIGGYAAVFNTASRNLGGFVEVIDPKAFNDSAGRGWPDVLARYNHDDNLVLGTTRARTLRLEVDEVGLRYEVDVPESRGDVLELVSRGDVAKSSFAFRVVGPDGERWRVNDLGVPERRVLNAQLVDVAPVNSPAYVDTSVGALRHLAEQLQLDEAEVRSAAAAGRLAAVLSPDDDDRAGGDGRITFGPAAAAYLASLPTVQVP